MIRHPTMMARSDGARARNTVLGLSAMLGAVGLFWIGRAFVVDGHVRFGNPTDEAAVEPLASLAVRAEITRVQEGELVRPGQTCEFMVQPRLVRDGAYECSAQVVCGGRLLYGGPGRGYFPCRISTGMRRDVVGVDASTSRTDHDAALQLDTRLGVLHMWDDASGELGAFRLDAEVLSTQ